MDRLYQGLNIPKRCNTNKIYICTAGKQYLSKASEQILSAVIPKSGNMGQLTCISVIKVEGLTLDLTLFQYGFP